MRTPVLRVDPVRPEPAAIERAAAVIRAGGLVAFPTETVYGLGADALDERAVRRIFEAKGRAFDDPCIVHLADAGDLPRMVADVPPAVGALAARCWPGPLSLVLRKSPAVPDIVTAGRPTVAVRVPSHAVARALIRAAGVPIAAPSANRFMHTSPTTAEHVLADLDGRLDLILDGGPTPVGVESTVLDLTGPVPRVLRPGGVTVETLRAILGHVETAEREASKPAGPLPSPGLMPKHYAPNAELTLFVGPPDRVLAAIRARAATLIDQGRRVGALVAEDDLPALALPGLIRVSVGPAADLDGVARRLFAALRELEAHGVDVILARGFARTGVGAAIDDRLTRAAAGRVVRL